MSAHLLVSRQKGYGRTGIIESFSTYDEALAAYEAVDGFDKDLAVRSDDDPQWKHAKKLTGPYADEWNSLAQKARWAAGHYRSEELGRMAREVIKSARNDTFRVLEKTLAAGLASRGFKPRTFDVTDALKSRCTIGRCWNCDRAYWFPKSSKRPLHSVRCSLCEGRLNQTTLTLRKPFYRLPLEEG